MSGFRWICTAAIVVAALSLPQRAAAQVYGLSHDRSTGSSQVVSINSTSGMISPIGVGLAGCCELGLGASAIDATGLNIYAVGPEPMLGGLQLVQYALPAGTGTVVGLLGTSDRVLGMEYHSGSQSLIALLATSTSGLRLVSINTSTGAATQINSGLSDCCVLEPGLTALSGSNFLFVGRLRTDSSSTRAVYAFSTSGDNAVSTTVLTPGTRLAALAVNSGSGLVYALQQNFSVTPGAGSLQLVRLQRVSGLIPVGSATAACCAVAIDTATIEGGAMRVVAHEPGTTGLSILSFDLTSGASSFSAATLPDNRIINGLLGVSVIAPAVTINQSSGTTTVTEGGATDTYTMVLATQPSADVTLSIATDAQLSTSPVALTFTTANWSTPQTVTVTAVDDAITEGQHLGTITHSATGGDYAGISIASVTASITDNDSASLSIADVTLNEGNAGNTSFSFNVTLNGAVASGFTVAVSSADGSAIAGSDYTTIPGGTQLSFSGSNGQTQAVIVNVLGDTVVEPNEAFSVNLAAPSNPLVTLSDASGAGAIVNDDSATVAIDNVMQAEGDSGSSSFAFTATLTGTVQGGFTVPYQSTNGTASAGTDYTAVSGTLIFTGVNGQTQSVLVAVAGDTTPEADEDFFVDLGGASVAGVVVNPSRGTGSVINDDLNADIAVSNSNGVNTLTPDQTTTYTVVISNTSSVVDVPAVQIVQTLSPVLINVCWTCTGSGGATCPASGTGVINSTLALPKNSSVSYAVTATVDPEELMTIDASVSATVQSPYSDLNPSNNSVTDSDPRIWEMFKDGFEDLNAPVPCPTVIESR